MADIAPPSLDSTEAITNVNPNSAFVTLTPINEAAIRAFSKVVDTVSAHPHHFEHQSQFFASSVTQCPLSSLVRGQSVSSTSGSAAEPDVEPETTGYVVELVWTGNYHISLKTLPKFPFTSWRAGQGRWSKENLIDDVELLLSCDKDDGLRRIHADFAFDKQTGILMLNAYHGTPNGVKMNGSHFGRPDSSRALNARTAIIQMGKLEYKFTYIIEPNSAAEAAFQTDKIDYFRDRLQAPAPIESTSATPSENDTNIGDWTLHGAVGRGAYGVVSAASHRLGNPVVAFKCFSRGSRTEADAVAEEVKTAQQLILHSNEAQKNSDFVIKMKEVIYGRGHAEWNGTFEYVYILYTPLARGTFYSHLLKAGPRPSRNIVISLFSQVLSGLGYLHSIGWIHRDLKPANLGVVSLDPPHAVILDLGQAMHVDADLIGRENDSNGFISPTPGRVGTSLYLAPEMEKRAYTETVDIWALGIVAYEIIFHSHPFKLSPPANPWLLTTNPRFRETVDSYNSMMEELAKGKVDPMEPLIREMLVWIPEWRMKAKDALKHSALAEATLELPKEEPKVGSKRQRESN